MRTEKAFLLALVLCVGIACGVALLMFGGCGGDFVQRGKGDVDDGELMGGFSSQDGLAGQDRGLSEGKRVCGVGAVTLAVTTLVTFAFAGMGYMWYSKGNQLSAMEKTFKEVLEERTTLSTLVGIKWFVEIMSGVDGDVKTLMSGLDKDKATDTVDFDIDEKKDDFKWIESLNRINRLAEAYISTVFYIASRSEEVGDSAKTFVNSLKTNDEFLWMCAMFICASNISGKEAISAIESITSKKEGYSFGCGKECVSEIFGKIYFILEGGDYKEGLKELSFKQSNLADVKMTKKDYIEKHETKKIAKGLIVGFEEVVDRLSVELVTNNNDIMNRMADNIVGDQGVMVTVGVINQDVLNNDVPKVGKKKSSK